LRLNASSLREQYARFYWTPGARQALIEHARSYDTDRAALRPRLAELTRPVLIVWTDADPYLPLSVGRRLLDLLPSARLKVLDNAGHLPQEEQPTMFDEAVLDWLSPVSATSVVQ
jgi:pimeloyl-ACP methyl ester carboxylesterase